MFKKLATISLTLIAALTFAAAPAFAKTDNPNASFNKPSKTEIVYDLPDSGDNAHPSGNDRSVEHGRSLTQGNAQSDPDDDGRGPDRSNGGDDKQPNGLGGVDKADQDNNNGCGNDDDFEDDNEGWCGQKPKNDSECKYDCEPECKYDCEPGCQVDCEPGCTQNCEPECETNCEPECTDNCGGECVANCTPETPEDPDQPEVLGITTLPNTGVPANFSWVIACLSLIGGGATLRYVSRKENQLEN